ncbi:ExeA family protein [Rubinisphaera brasiliensis]|uniref:ORC1/DEAH AAA+ ATPase domain-containing protein n=1 Tax=Rubinisphaera brasiliensis (strain ATCC 49424 / DSM 5305 / JCM 21570 / IAM 15109 / NBRC 103401 / IFAM 1448) TaxID=756272 RepID=F0SRT4_RUBBR|nr:AAA family ATPase [Rubinisphaera brasiliensis]ADY60250.1 hypothetical protein Plabr_2650 [Rubinisphaera brasiliensis DSM 5305]
MYQKFFNLTQRPFSATPDPHVVYNSPSMRVSLNALEQTLRQGEGIGLLTAAAGTGKTLLCKVLGERLANDPLPVLLLNSSYATRSALLQAILFELDRPYSRMSEQELRLELVHCGRKLAESNTGVALIVDEAHLLGEHILEELRALTNFVYEARPVFRVVLSGQMPLEDTLASRSLEALNQRLKCHVTLETLTRQESLEYLITRVECAGGNLLRIFSEPSLELIIHAADGLPRCLNQLADHACLLATVEGSEHVEPRHVREALDDLQKLPLHWNTPLPTQDPISELKGTDATNWSSKPAAAPATPASASFDVDEAIEDEIEDAMAAKVPPAPPQVSEPSSHSPHTAVIEIGGDDEADAPTPVPVHHPSKEKPPAETVLEADVEADLMSIEEELDEEFAELGTETSEAECCEASSEECSDVVCENTVCEEVVSEEVAKAPVAPRLPEIETVNDRYAALDARRKGHLREAVAELASQPADCAEDLCSETVPSCEDDLSAEEYKIAQTVLEISSDVSAALAGNPDAIMPPEVDLNDAIDSEAARNDLVDPHRDGNAGHEPSDYDRLYSELRRKQEE